VGLLAMVDAPARIRRIGSQVTLTTRIKLHSSNLRQLEPMAWPAYLASILRRKVSSASRQAGLALRRLVKKEQTRDHWTSLPPGLSHALARKMMYRDYPKHGLAIPQGYRHLRNVHMMALQFYVPRLYPGQIILFPSIQAGRRRYLNPDLGWARLAAGGVEVHEMPGDHNAMLAEPHVRILAQELNLYLDPTKKPH
jgi:thioesterase domain-containing protein